MIRRAKIIATLGPASSEETALARLFDAGVDVVRLNLSHGDSQEHRQNIAKIRKVADDKGLYVPVLLDLMGPRYRLGEVPNGPRWLNKGETVTLASETSDVAIPLSDSDLLRHLRTEQRLLIDGGLVELQVTKALENRAEAVVVIGGPISTRKGINLPDTDLPFEISDKDRTDIALAVQEQADYLAASYVGQASDLTRIRDLVRDSGGDLPIMAKLERARGVANLQEIVDAADAVMVARGDLGVEVPLHRVPVLQKKIIDSCLRAGKPVIVATQMLESMMEHHRPTRAESSDVANAVLDGADGMLLSGETAVGQFPAETVETIEVKTRKLDEPDHLSRAARSPTRSLAPLSLRPPTWESVRSSPSPRAVLPLACCPDTALERRFSPLHPVRRSPERSRFSGAHGPLWCTTACRAMVRSSNWWSGISWRRARSYLATGSSS